MYNRSKTQRSIAMLPLQLIVFSFFLLLNSNILQAGTYHVPADFQSIQMAIDSVSPEGDTVVVAPGSYVENIDYLGKNIFLTSNYYVNSDDSLIQQTIIDGGENDAVVTFIGGENRSAVLNGFTITNGSGRQIGDHTKGGGIYLNESGPSITNCLITGNRCCGTSGGGGIYALRAPIYMSNLIITKNSAQYYGGGLYTGNSNIEMDSLNRCSIFLNEAGAFNDIFQFFDDESPPSFYLDTATVATYDGYFFGGNLDLEVDILNSKLEPVQYDLWVSPFGDNNNSGASPADPLKTITYAFHIINTDSLHPLTVHLLPGVYTPSGGQNFPINLRSYVSLIGSGRDSTIIDLEYTIPAVMTGFNEERNYTIRSMSIIHTARVGSIRGIRFAQNTRLVIEDILFSSNESSRLVGASFTEWMTYLENTSMTIRDCKFIDNYCVGIVTVAMHAEVLIQNCQFENTTPLEDVDPEEMGMASALRLIAPSSFYPYQYSHRVENCVFTNNINNYTDYYTFSPGLNIFDYRYPVNIVNCTFADNSSLVSGGIRIFSIVPDMEVRLVNCLLWNNELFEIYIDGELQPPESPTRLRLFHNIIQDLEDGILQLGNSEITFEGGNLSADPFFLGDGDHPYQLTEGSPAIDAGIAFWVVDGDTVVNLSPDQYSGSAPDIGAYEFDQQAVIPEEPPQLPDQLAITSVYPNPFNNNTTITFVLPHPDQVELSLYNITGQLVDTVIDAWIGAGEHNVRITTRDYASGVYVVKLESKLGWDSRLLTLVK